MATTERQATAWHYGERMSGSTWTTPSSPDFYVYTGSFNSNPATNRQIARQTFAGMARIDTIGTLKSLRIYTDTANTSTNGGAMYVSSTALAPKDVVANAKKTGDWSTPNGTAFWMSLTNLSLANLLTAIGSSTTWYCYWDNNVTSSRALFTETTRPKWEITHDPGMMHPNVGGVFQTGQPHANVGGAWKLGMAHANVGGVWKIGI